MIKEKIVSMSSTYCKKSFPFLTESMLKLKNSSGSWLTLFPNGLHLFVLSHVPGQLSSSGLGETFGTLTVIGFSMNCVYHITWYISTPVVM